MKTIRQIADEIGVSKTAAAAQALHAGTMKQQLLTGEAGADQQEAKVSMWNRFADQSH